MFTILERLAVLNGLRDGLSSSRIAHVVEYVGEDRPALEELSVAKGVKTTLDCTFTLAPVDHRPRCTAGVALAEALLAAAEGCWQESGVGFCRSVETSEHHGLLCDQARAMYQWAVMYLDRADSAQDRQRGLELLDQSLALFQRCEAKKDVERVIARKEEHTQIQSLLEQRWAVWAE